MENRKLATCLISVAVFAVVAILAVPCVWAILYFGVYIGYGNNMVRGHQDFAANGVSQIESAAQMDATFDDCRHYISYGPNDVPLFNSVAYFGERYELTMQVPVQIDSATSGHTVGEPKFYLDEIVSVTITPSGQISVSFSRNLDFDAKEWEQVYDGGGDFGKIGFAVNATPVANFQKYADASRPSN